MSPCMSGESHNSMAWGRPGLQGLSRLTRQPCAASPRGFSSPGACSGLCLDVSAFVPSNSWAESSGRPRSQWPRQSWRLSQPVALLDQSCQPYNIRESQLGCRVRRLIVLGRACCEHSGLLAGRFEDAHPDINEPWGFRPEMRLFVTVSRAVLGLAALWAGDGRKPSWSRAAQLAASVADGDADPWGRRASRPRCFCVELARPGH